MKLKRILKTILLIIITFSIIFFLTFFYRKLNVVKNSQVIETNHFTINYNGILEKEAIDISESLETNYDRIRTDLNDPKHEKINVFIHATQDEFNKATGLPNSTANGTSRGPLAFHLKYDTWFNTFIPADMNKVAVHEFTHCVQLNILIQDAMEKGIYNINEAEFNKEFESYFLANYPQWFWEAICDYEAGMVNRISVKYGMKDNLNLEQLNTNNQIYNVGYTVVEYLVNTFGKEKLPDFIISYCDFEKILGVTEKEFENGWHKFVKQNY